MFFGGKGKNFVRGEKHLTGGENCDIMGVVSKWRGRISSLKVLCFRDRTVGESLSKV
jgi:hypothetical protein